jgi:hypothetical protein
VKGKKTKGKRSENEVKGKVRKKAKGKKTKGKR